MKQSLFNPNGISYYSPGLRQRRYPGITGEYPHNPNGVASVYDMDGSWEFYATPIGVDTRVYDLSQVAAFAATLGFVTQPRWGKKPIFPFSLTAMDHPPTHKGA